LLPLAESNSEYALLTLGWIYETGATGVADKNLARSYYERAAAQGSAAAYHDLGQLLLGQGNATRARTLFEAGAEQGNIASMAKLGRMFVEGSGGRVDTEAGIAWLKEAAAQGHIFAQRTLLDIEERNAKTISQKLSVKLKIAALATAGAKTMLKDPASEKLR
jgi:TPR repeat protein